MKKVLASILVVCVVFGAGAAIAAGTNQQQQRNNNFRPNMMQQDPRMNRNFQQGPCYNFERGPRGDFGQCPCDFNGRDGRIDKNERAFNPGPRGPMFAPDMPKEIRAKSAELAKLKIDLEEAMSDRPVNKAKAMEVHAKIQKLEAEIEAWRFERALDMIEEVRMQREINKKIPPAQKAPEDKVNAN